MELDVLFEELGAIAEQPLSGLVHVANQLVSRCRFARFRARAHIHLYAAKLGGS